MSKGDLRLSETHGVNPSVGVCFWCGEDDTVILFGRLPGDREAPRRVCLSYDPCKKCEEKMALGIRVMECDERATQDGQQPINPGQFLEVYPAGRWWVITEEAVRRFITDVDTCDQVIAKRGVMLPVELCKRLGFYDVEPTQKEESDG